jgi:hypothetical protein
VIFLNIFLERIKKQRDARVEKSDITLFLENVMIREDGLFTLLGSKPITQFDIAETLIETEEEILREYEQSKDFLEKCRQDPEHFHSDNMQLPDYEVYREKCLKNRHALRFIDHKKLWENWLKEKGGISTPLYRLTYRKDQGMLINILNTLFILKKYYSDFSRMTEMEFDIQTILDSINDPESKFWDEVFKNHYLFGLLMGYGQKNAYLFDWISKNRLPLKAISFGRFKEFSRLNQHHELMRKIDVDIYDLEIPYFVSFEIDNEDVERYTREKEKIIAFLKDKDLISFVLSQFLEPV